MSQKDGKGASSKPILYFEFMAYVLIIIVKNIQKITLHKTPQHSEHLTVTAETKEEQK